MKSLLIGACLCSAVAVAAPQFPGTATLSAAGVGMDVRPASICVEGVSAGSYATMNLSLGTMPTDFVVTEILGAASFWPALSKITIRTNGVAVASAGASEGYTASPTQGSGAVEARFQHGIVLPAGSSVIAEVQTMTSVQVHVTLAGYIR